MVIVTGKIYVDAQVRDAYLRGCVSIVEQARRPPGCLDFALTADLVEPDRINVYERWESDAHLEKFRGEGPSAAQTVQIRDTQVMKYRISGTEAP